MKTFVSAHGGPSISNYAPYRGERVVVAKISWAAKDLPTSAMYNVVFLDPSGQVAASTIAGYQSEGQVTIGWDGRFDVLSKTYPFLHATNDASAAVEFSPQSEAPMWVVARFPRDSAIDVARPGDQPIVGAFLTGLDEHIYWAERLSAS